MTARMQIINIEVQGKRQVTGSYYDEVHHVSNLDATICRCGQMNSQADLSCMPSLLEVVFMTAM